MVCWGLGGEEESTMAEISIPALTLIYTKNLSLKWNERRSCEARFPFDALVDVSLDIINRAFFGYTRESRRGGERLHEQTSKRWWGGKGEIGRFTHLIHAKDLRGI